MGWDRCGLVPIHAPTPHIRLSRRSQSLDIECPRVPATGPIHLIVDATGLSFVGEGEWAAVKHGGSGRRGWKKLHLGVDRSGVIVAHALTEATVDDATTGVDLIEAVAGKVRSARLMVPTTRSRSTRPRLGAAHGSSFHR